MPPLVVDQSSLRKRQPWLFSTEMELSPDSPATTTSRSSVRSRVWTRGRADTSSVTFSGRAPVMQVSVDL